MNKRPDKKRSFLCTTGRRAMSHGFDFADAKYCHGREKGCLKHSDSLFCLNSYRMGVYFVLNVGDEVF